MKRNKVIALLMVASMTLGSALPVMAEDVTNVQEIVVPEQRVGEPPVQVEEVVPEVETKVPSVEEPVQEADTISQETTAKEKVPEVISEASVQSEDARPAVTVGDIFEVGDFEYVFTSDTTVSVRDYSGFGLADMVILQEVEYGGFKYKVTGIQNSACQEVANVETITVPEGVTDIGDMAFAKSPNLRSIEIQDPNANCVTRDGIMYSSDMTELRLYPSSKQDESYKTPDSVTTIKRFAITGTNYLKNLTFSDSVTDYGDDSVVNLESTEVITTGANTSKLGQGVFAGCKNLKELNLQGDSIEMMMYAVYRNPKLGTITLNGNITMSMGYNFYNLPSLKEFVVSNSTEEKSVDGVLYMGDTLMVYPPAKEDKTYVVPEGTKQIGPLAFSYSQNLTSIIVAPGVFLNEASFNSPTNPLNIYMRDENSVNIVNGVTIIFREFPAGSHVYGKNQNVVNSILVNPKWVDKGISVEVGAIPATAVTIDATSATLNVGEKKTVKATIAPYYSTETIKWESSNSAVATVDDKGNITAVAAGSAVITAKAGTVKGVCAVTVKSPLKGISLDKTEVSLKKGGSTTLAVTYNPTDTTDSKTVTWSSSDNSVSVKDGKVTANARGTATITAKVGTFTATCKVSVGIPLEGISISNDKVTINKGESTTLTVNYSPSDTTDSKVIAWSSSNDSIASVKDGKVTANAPGTATVTAKVGGYTTSCKVTVKAPLLGISLDKSSLSLPEGKNDTLKVSLNPSDTTDSKSVTWKSSDEDIAKVSADGKVIAKAAGTATITATVGKQTAQCNVTVTEVVINYPDIAKSAWYYNAVKWASQKGIMSGYQNGTFGAADALTRGQFATTLYRLEGKPAFDYQNVFPDVPAETFYSVPAVWANHNKIITGYENGNFGSSDLVTREQLATMLYRYAKSEGYDTSMRADLSGYPDVNKVSSFARESMQWAVATGLIKGDQGNLNPQGKSVRAVAATILMRFENAYE